MKPSSSKAVRVLLIDLAALFLLAGTAAAQEDIEIETGHIGVGVDHVVLRVQATGRTGPIQAFVLAVGFDPTLLEVVDFSPAGVWLLTNPPDFVRSIGTSSTPGEPGVAGLAVVLDDQNDGLSKVIPSAPGGVPQPIARLSVRLLTDRLGCVRFEEGGVRFGGGVDGVNMINSLVIRRQDYYAGADRPGRRLRLRSGGIETDATFVRGDADSSGTINLTDGVRILNWLFLGGPVPDCLDAADTDDDGSINLTDAVRIFDWLFRGGPPPPDPSPSRADHVPTDCGPDPTCDPLDCARMSEKCRSQVP